MTPDLIEQEANTLMAITWSIETLRLALPPESKLREPLGAWSAITAELGERRLRSMPRRHRLSLAGPGEAS